jgi:hypothetical protein
MFAEGGWLDTIYFIKDCNGVDVLMHGKYHSNAFNIIVLTLLSFIFLSIPYVFTSVYKPFKWISTLGATWMLAALCYQIIGAIIPDSFLMEIMREKWTVVKFSSMFTIGIMLIIINEIWNQQKSY